MEPLKETKPQTYLGQVFGSKLGAVPLVFFALLVGAGIYSARNPTPDISGPLGMGNGGLLIGFGLVCLSGAFIFPLLSKESRRRRGK